MVRSDSKRSLCAADEEGNNFISFFIIENGDSASCMYTVFAM